MALSHVWSALPGGCFHNSGYRSASIFQMFGILDNLIENIIVHCCHRSPGGTPFRAQRDPAEFDCSDPAALIARALRKKFAAQQRNCESPDRGKYNDSPASSVGDRSTCWSPSPRSDEQKPPPVCLCLFFAVHYYGTFYLSWIFASVINCPQCGLCRNGC